jgi:NADH:ubiquinone oxidoreductase subunit E
MADKVGAVAVLGGGISGMQAALDLADSGLKVYLVDNKPAIGGVMAQLDKTFPTNDCAMCTMAPRLVEIGRHKDVEIITLSDIEKIEGVAGNFKVILNKKPRYINEEKCTGCGTCITNCPTRNIVQPIEKTKVELEPEFREEVLEIIQKNKDRKGPLMTILQQVNSAFNYLPENALQYISQELGYPLSHIFKIATFYSSLSIVPRGKHIINVCMGTACYVRGSGRLMERLSDLLNIKEKETTPDMLFTLQSVRCIGCCGLAPAVMSGDNVYGKLTPKDIPGIIEKYKTII